MTKVTIPAISQRLVDDQGCAVNIWYDKLKFLEKLQPLSDLPADPTLPALLTPGNTTVTVTVGALTDNSPAPGTIQTFLIYGGGVTPAQIQDNFTTLVSYITKIRTDLLASQTAEAALNTRITALENKVNALITALS